MRPSAASPPDLLAADESPTHARPKGIASPLRDLALASVALFALGLMLAPATFWHHPATNAAYSGFDRNLVHVDPAGGGSATGIILVSRDSIQMLAVPGSRPTVDLLSSDIDFQVSADLKVLRNDTSSSPLTVMIWSPRENTSYSLSFGPGPVDQIRSNVMRDGSVKDSRLLGTYSPGIPYHIDVALMRGAGRLSVTLRSAESPPAANAINVVGGPSEPGYTEVVSDYVSVSAGHEYSFGGILRDVQGADSYKLILDWFDRNKKRVGSAGDWRSVSDLNGWTERIFAGTAPPGAVYARMTLGAGNGRTQILITNLFIRDTTTGSGQNLLKNGDFQNGTVGWGLVGPASPQQSLQTEALRLQSLQAGVDSASAPALFYKLPVAVTVRSASDTGLSSISMQNYRLALPTQGGQVNRADDRVARLAAVLLIVGGGLLCVRPLFPGIFQRLLVLAGRSPRVPPARAVQVRRRHWVAAPVLLLTAAYVLLNALLFSLGEGTFDMAGEKIFSYVGAYYGSAELYFLPSTVTPAEVWGGVPFAGVTFPYGPVMVWFFTAIGWLYRLIGVGPYGPEMHSFGLDFLIKTANLIFGLLDGVLIYLILRRSGARERTSRLAAALFLLNPAVLFLMSVWGETQTVTLSFLLMAILAAQRNRATLAWMFVAAASLSRPQLIVPSFILGVLLLSWFRPATNVRALAWMVVVVGLVAAPLFFSLGPSFLGGYLISLIHSQAAADPHAAQYNYVSYDGYNIWPFVTGVVSGQVGKARIYYPEAAQLLGGFTYKTVANGAFGAALGLIFVWAVVKGRQARANGTFIPILASATLALLMLETGIAAQHFVIALAFVIMSINVISRPLYYPLVIALSLTTLVSMYGSLGFALSYPGAGALAPALYGGTNALTRFFMDQFASDRFITMAIAANCAVFLAMAVASVFGRGMSGHLATGNLASSGDEFRDEDRVGRLPLGEPTPQ